jgi:ATP-binding protein involved in chromosome partitioning
MTPNQPGQPPKMPIPGVKNLIAVGSGKGGVGKTTVAVNLAVGLGPWAIKTGLMDADVYGPNVPLMMGINRTPMARANASSRSNSSASSSCPWAS